MLPGFPATDRGGSLGPRPRSCLPQSISCPFEAFHTEIGAEHDGAASSGDFCVIFSPSSPFSVDFLNIMCYIKTIVSWRDGRVDEGATLEMWCGATHRGFESLSLRHFKNALPGRGAFFMMTSVILSQLVYADGSRWNEAESGGSASLLETRRFRCAGRVSCGMRRGCKRTVIPATSLGEEGGVPRQGGRRRDPAPPARRRGAV